MMGENRFLAGAILGCVVTALVLTQFVQGQARGSQLLAGSLSHISFAVGDVEKTAKAFADVFGAALPKPQEYRDIPWGPAYPGKTMNGKLISLQINGVTFEFLQPLDGESPWKDYLKKSGDGVHHVGFAVKDTATVKAARDYLVSKGGKQTQAFAEWAAYVDMHGAGLPITFEITTPLPAANAPARRK